MFPDFHVPIFVILTPVLPERRRTENLTSRADRFPPMPPRSEPQSEQCGRICGLPLFEPKVENRVLLASDHSWRILRG
jgi:hypothetical protein